MRTSVIAYPRRGRFLVIRPEYTTLTGSGAAGVVLAVLEGWTNWRLECADQRHETPDLWLRLPMKQLMADACELYGRRALETGIEKLLELGFVERKEASGTDRSFLWRLDVEAVNSALSTLHESAVQVDESPPLARASESGLKRIRKESKNAGAPAPEIDPEVSDVWAYWCERRQPRRLELEPAQAKLIARGLKVATVVELKGAIDALLNDSFYRENKLLVLSSLLATKPGGPTLRDQIDRFLDKAPAPSEPKPLRRRDGEIDRLIRRAQSWKTPVLADGSDPRDVDVRDGVERERLADRDAAIEELRTRFKIATTFDANGRPVFEDIP